MFSPGKTSEVVRGSALGANKGYMLAHCGGGIEKQKGGKRKTNIWDEQTHKREVGREICKRGLEKRTILMLHR